MKKVTKITQEERSDYLSSLTAFPNILESDTLTENEKLALAFMLIPAMDSENGECYQTLDFVQRKLAIARGSAQVLLFKLCHVYKFFQRTSKGHTREASIYKMNIENYNQHYLWKMF